MKIIQSIKNIKRFNQIISIFIKNGFYDIVKKINDGSFKLPAVKKNDYGLNTYQRIRKTIEELGPTFIKLAQMLSIRPDLIPIELIDEFEKLQDRVTPVDIEEISPIFETELKKNINEIFLGELKLIASASIGQVYKGVLLSGEEVAIKVQKPGIKEEINTDIDILKAIADMFDNVLAPYGIKSLKEVTSEFEMYMADELDYLKEAKNLKRFTKMFENEKRIKIPKLYEEYSTSKIVTMEFIQGIKINDVSKYSEYNINNKKIAKVGFDLLCDQIFVHRFFHADPHPGNLFITKDKKIAFIDFGLMGMITKKDQKNILECIYYLVKGNEEKAALNLLKMTNYSDEIDTDSFIKDADKLFNNYLFSSLKDIKIKDIFYDLSKMISKYNLSFKKEFFILIKALITYEGVGNQIDSNFNAYESIKPVILKIYKKEFSFKNIFSKMGEIPKEISDFFEYSAYDAKDILKQIKDGRIKIQMEHVGIKALSKNIEKSVNRLTISIVIAAILIGSSILVYSDIPPIILGVPFFGFVGFVVAFIMGLVLIYSIYKGGRL